MLEKSLFSSESTQRTAKNKWASISVGLTIFFLSSFFFISGNIKVFFPLFGSTKTLLVSYFIGFFEVALALSFYSPFSKYSKWISLLLASSFIFFHEINSAQVAQKGCGCLGAIPAPESFLKLSLSIVGLLSTYLCFFQKNKA